MSKRHKFNDREDGNNFNEEPPSKKPHDDFKAPKPSRGRFNDNDSSNGDNASPAPSHVRPVTPETSHARPVTPESTSGSKPASVSDAAAAKDDALQGVPVTEFRVSQENIDQLAKRGITSLFPIQSGTFDYIYDGQDVVGRAQTGSGKTLSFVLPLVERIIEQNPPSAFRGWRKPRIICVAPTRELARQNAEEFERCTAHTSMKTVLVYGGTQISTQCKELNYGADIIVGTPGRIIDLTERNALDLTSVEFDEADEMLSIGFAQDVDTILSKLPKDDKQPQMLLFSATLPEWVMGVIEKNLREDYASVDLIGNEGKNRKVPQGVKHYAMCCKPEAKPEVIRNILAIHKDVILEGSRTMVFTSTKKEADDLVSFLSVIVNCHAIHGDVSQSIRESTLRDFRSGKFPTLIATDVAARGLDISGVDRVIMTHPPKDVESYIHRSGRTGRAGSEGISITLYSRGEVNYLQQIQRAAGFKFHRIGTPQATEIIKVSLPVVSDDMAKISKTTTDTFTEDAKAFAEKFGGEIPALARALALLAKVPAEGEEHSPLGGLQGYKTVLMRTQRPLPAKPIAISIFTANAPRGIDFKEVALCNDGAVIDVPYKDVDRLLSTKPNRRDISFEVVDQLPEGVEIQEDDFRRGGFGRGGGFGGGGGGYGGRNGGGYGGGYGGRNGGGGGYGGGYGGRNGGGDYGRNGGGYGGDYGRNGGGFGGRNGGDYGGRNGGGFGGRNGGGGGGGGFGGRNGGGGGGFGNNGRNGYSRY